MTAFDLIWIVPVMVAMLLLKGFFSGSEIALVNSDKLKLSHRAKRGDRGARLVVSQFERPERILAATLIGTNIATVALTTLGALTMIHFLGSELGDLYAFLIFTPALLVLGEIVPKSIYQQKSDEIAPAVIRPLRIFGWLFSPIVLVFGSVARMAARLAGGGATSHHMFVTRDQLRSLMEMAERAGGAAVFDRIRIERAIRFSESLVGSEMVPVAEMTAIEKTKATADAIRQVRRRGFNRLPVYEGDTSNIVGVVTLTTWDLLEPGFADRPLSELMRPARYVSPQERLEDLLPVLRDRDDQMAIVVDEYGSTIGMITVDDIIGSVVGDIAVGCELEEQPPRRQRRVEALSGDEYRIDGRLPIPELNDLLGLGLPSTEFHTIGGMMVARLQHLPAPGESILEGGFRFTVEEASERAVRRVRVAREPLSDGARERAEAEP